MDRISLFRNILSRIESLTIEPQMEPVWVPIIEQLQYLVSFEAGEEIDRSKIENMDIGLRALRNLNDIYPDVSKELFQVQREAEAMASECGKKNRLAL